MYAESDFIKFIESVFGSGTLSSRGTNFVIRCPNCDSSNKDKKKLSIRLIDHVNHCWVCGWGSRSLLPLLIKHADQSSIHEYKTRFAEGKTFSDKEKIEEDVFVPKLPRDFMLLAASLGTKDLTLRPLIKYCLSRGLTEQDLWKFCLGASKDYEYRGRVIMPSFDENGEINFITARSINSITSLKYLNSNIHKNEIIFNEINLDFSKRITLVEGPFDLIKCVENSTCLLGSEVSEKSKLFDKLLHNETPVNLCLDSDMKQKSQNIARKLMSYKLDVRIVDLGDKKDPGEMSKRDLKKAVDAAKPWSWKSMLESRINSSISTSMKF